MPEFKRYRDKNGSEFSLAVSPELAAKKGWTDVTSDDNPAVGPDGKPLRAKPAEPENADETAAAPKPNRSTVSASPTTTKEN